MREYERIGENKSERRRATCKPAKPAAEEAKAARPEVTTTQTSRHMSEYGEYERIWETMRDYEKI